MPYNFSNLSPADFEDLARELIGAELNIRFEAFAPGPDGGIDGRHSQFGTIILQAKHYVGSTYPKLRAAMKRERPAIDKLSPERYLLVTSRPLTPPNKTELATIIGPSLKRLDDIFTPGDLNLLLRKHTKVHKNQLKLWLSETSVLESIVHAASEAFTKITKAEIEDKVRLYAVNPSFYEANATLAAQHIVIISGPPGVGKTTLAEMLAFTHLKEGWELIAIRGLDDGFAKINDLKKQVFLFDDFLGKIALDKHALAHTDSELARFIRRVAKSPNARFILTTRAYIFEEARRVSEHLADTRLDVTRYLLDVGKYTRRIKARILYNHLLVSNTPHSHVVALIDSDALPKIVDHPHYNPRIIEFMTDTLHVKSISAEQYPTNFLEALAHPDMIWDVAFRTHISKPCQHLLYCLYFTREWFGAPLSELHETYASLHPRLSLRYGDPHDPKDFEEALKVLEGGFVTISNGAVNFINPSLRDYLARYLTDVGLLAEIAASAQETEWANSVWVHAVGLKPSQPHLAAVALAFKPFISKMLSLPTFTRRQERGTTYRSPHGLSNTRRIELFLEWYDTSIDPAFWEAALKLAQNPVSNFDSWRDGTDLIELIVHIRDGGYFDNLPDGQQLADILEDGLVKMIEQGVASDQLEGLADAVDEYLTTLGQSVAEAMDELVRGEIEAIDDVVDNIDSESDLESHGKLLARLGRRVGATSQELERITERIKIRISRLEDETPTSSSPSVGPGRREADKFDDAALRGLFQSLRQS